MQVLEVQLLLLSLKLSISLSVCQPKSVKPPPSCSCSRFPFLRLWYFPIKPRPPLLLLLLLSASVIPLLIRSPLSSSDGFFSQSCGTGAAAGETERQREAALSRGWSSVASHRQDRTPRRERFKREGGGKRVTGCGFPELCRTYFEHDLNAQIARVSARC